MTTALLLTLCAALIVLYVVERFGSNRRLHLASREMLLALKYIADSREGKASQFALLWLSGNERQLTHSFPDFEAYRRERIIEEEDEADHAGA